MRPDPPVAPKPLVARKPAAPSKPPRKVPQQEAVENQNTQINIPATSGKITSSVVNSGPNRHRIGSEVQNNLISQLKKNLEGQAFSSPPKNPPPPKSPPTAARKLAQPLYAVSPFTSGNKTQALPSEYDVPLQNPVSSPPSSSDNKQSGFVYAVSPFHSGSQTSAQQVDQNLYDTPAHKYSHNDDENLYDTPMQFGRKTEDEHLYDTPAPQSEYDVVRNGRPAQATPAENSHSPAKQMQFMYALSPFASVQSPRKPEGSNQYDDVGQTVEGGPYEEAGYCEVGNLVRGVPPGYAEVGETFDPSKYESESIYSVPRDERR